MKNVSAIVNKHKPTISGVKVLYVTVVSKDRVALRDSVEEALKKDNIKYDRNMVSSKSGFALTTFIAEDGRKTNIVYKSGGGGSGAGAAITKLGESAQCLYASYAFHVKKGKMSDLDVSEKKLLKGIRWAVTDEKTDNMIHKLPDDWMHSSIAGANKLFESFNTSYVFHRGSPTVNKIENTFKRINRIEKAFGNLNKWSPADIYMVHTSFNIDVIVKANTLAELNQIMMKEFEASRLIGVSLKKIEQPKGRLSWKNYDKKKSAGYKYKQYTLTDTSLDMYLITDKGRIQFRSFGGASSLTGWQGEGKGSSANQGKISLGPINYILKANKVKQIPDSKDSAMKARKNAKPHATTIARLLKKYVKGQKKHITADWVMSQSDQWRYSKYLGLMLVDTIESMPMVKRNKIMTQISMYSSSQTDHSAPYAKLE